MTLTGAPGIMTKEQALTLRGGNKVVVNAKIAETGCETLTAGTILTVADPPIEYFGNGMVSIRIAKGYNLLGNKVFLLHYNYCDIAMGGCTCPFNVWMYQGCKCGAFERERR